MLDVTVVVEAFALQVVRSAAVICRTASSAWVFASSSVMAGAVRQLDLPVIALTILANHPNRVVTVPLSPVGAVVSEMVRLPMMVSVAAPGPAVFSKVSAEVSRVTAPVFAICHRVLPLAAPSSTYTLMPATSLAVVSASALRLQAPTAAV
ncbi:hypothetical protein D3C75_1012190 [compost metagenome]